MLSVGVIGCGHWGPNLARNFALHPRCRLEYICDLDQARLSSCLERLKGVRPTTNWQDLIEDPQLDAVVVATPLSAHYELVKAALLAGKHVLSEKPLTGTYSTSMELIELAEKVGRVLMVGYVFFFNPAITRAARHINEGDLGDVQYAHAVRTSLGPIRYDVNALWDLASHDVSILLYTFGETPELASCTGGQFIGNPHPDVAAISLTFPSGRMGFLYASWLDPRKVRQITFVGSGKMMLFDDLSILEPLKIYDKGVAKQGYHDSFGSHLMAVRSGDVLVPQISSSEPLANECDAFVKAVLDGTPNPAMGRLTAEVAAVLEAADRSRDLGGSLVKVEL